ncbi:hypothetical protein NQ314_016288 [Rhamnusium bicolor]|uniref:Uncharacterized protein n=1 Tax=Rhamnusium bicolor TaxID=1586634 RepID=A0AAV8WWK1_9CUCU|nr:hypothetical protein NQ314_016288 [Rhamnusium bicolor]
MYLPPLLGVWGQLGLNPSTFFMHDFKKEWEIAKNNDISGWICSALCCYNPRVLLYLLQCAQVQEKT